MFDTFPNERKQHQYNVNIVEHHGITEMYQT